MGHPKNTATAYRRDLESWARWCGHLGVHPLMAERHHVDLWVRQLTTEAQPRTGRPATPATVVRKLSALSGFYDYGVHDAQVLTHSPVASVRRPGSLMNLRPLGSPPTSCDGYSRPPLRTRLDRLRWYTCSPSVACASLKHSTLRSATMAMTMAIECSR